jgi:hypothetical protein
MYLGFSQIPLAIGWTLEGKMGPELYGYFASKEKFSREVLGTDGMAETAIEAIPEGAAFDTLVHSRIGDLAMTELPGISADAASKLGAAGIEVWDLHDASPKDIAAAGLDEQVAEELLATAGGHLEGLYNAMANPITADLYASHSVSMVWDIMGIIGVGSAILIAIYGKWIQGRDLS